MKSKLAKWLDPYHRSRMRLKRFYVCVISFLIIGTTYSFAQTRTVSGTVIDSNRDPLIGVSVQVEGTTTGTMTDIDGKYSISASSTDQLRFSYLGMKQQIITVGSNTVINVSMEDDVTMLAETVVIGYGSAKAKDLTSPITTIQGDEIGKHLTASPMQSMQGKMPGIQVINTGQPGSSPIVRIRGVGTLNDEPDKGLGSKKVASFSAQGPLYVVDGMFFDDINFLSNSDIENISVLKDASAAAIYGVRAANGVILVTTKKGLVASKPRITYDGYVGFQKASNLVKMANSREYAEMMKEIGITSYAERSVELYGGTVDNPGVNTDWYDELLKTALIHSHSLNVSGGGDNITYVVGANYLSQDGIMKHTENDYERINTRAKIDVSLLENLKIGANLIVTNSSQNIAPEGAWRRAFIVSPLVPVYDENNEGAFPIKYASPRQIGYDEYFGNPVASAKYERHIVNGVQVMPSFYAELLLLDDRLSLKSSFNQSITTSRITKYMPMYQVSTNQKAEHSLLEKARDYQNNYVIDNIITYRDNFGQHGLTFMLGNSVRKEKFDYLYGKAEDIPDQEELWYISQGTETSKKSYDAGKDNRGVSFFGRLMYNYAGRYLLSATMRADGSSKYQEKWGYFPSIGAGWVISEENFLKEQRIFDLLKLRASWGKLGNDKIQPNYSFASVTQDLSTTGVFGDVQVPGVTSVKYFQDLKWEVVEEYNIGLDFALLNNRLSGEVDYYSRKTKNAVFELPLAFGAGTLLQNNGEITNSGVEVSLNWNDDINKDFSYNIGFNISTLKNRVDYLNGRERIATGSAEFRTYRILGEPIDSYYGYNVVGIYQNQQQLDTDPVAQNNNLSVGDFIYEDVNGDGDITDADKMIIGSKIPKVSIGGNMGFNYKNLDFSLSFFGQFGHKISNNKRGFRMWQTGINFDKDLYDNRWTKEGSTNKYPSAAAWGREWNKNKFSSFLVESANTFTIQNIQVGYTFHNIFSGVNKNSLRLSLTAERPFSFFSYNGFTTDITSGFDEQTYPLASTYSFGVKLTF